MFQRPEDAFHVYIITDKRRQNLYTGVTNNLPARLQEHYNNRGKDHTYAGRHHCHCLVYRESFRYIRDAIAREKQIKGWSRQKKIQLIESVNPDWEFLNEAVCGEWPPCSSLRSSSLRSE